MVYPSRGCITCRKRRVKCDFTRPTCTRCSKISRTCTWDLDTQTGLAFRSENTYAEGQPRRPRKQRQASALPSPSPSPGVSSSSRGSSRGSSPNSNAELVLVGSGTAHSPRPPPAIPLDTQALCFWVANFAEGSRDMGWGHGRDIGHEYAFFAARHLERSSEGSSLRLAVGAYSHAVFGRARMVDGAAAESRRFYTRTVERMGRDLASLTLATTAATDTDTGTASPTASTTATSTPPRLPGRNSGSYKETGSKIDGLMLATMIMTSYENFVYRGSPPERVVNDAVGSQYWEKVMHLEGTAGLLNMRKQLGYDDDSALCRIARRPIVRACILRGLPVHEWLRDGRRFGEEGPELELDDLMVRAAALRARYLKYCNARDGLAEMPSEPCGSPELATLALDAYYLVTSLDLLSPKLSEMCEFSTRAVRTDPGAREDYEWWDDFTYDGYVHTYTDPSHAAIWNRYRTMQIVARGMLLHLQRLEQPQLSEDSDSDKYYTPPETVAIATDVCRSVPYFFKLATAPHFPQNLVPKTVTPLTWPLAVLITADCVPVSQKQWLAQKLETIAEVLGDSVISSIAKKGGFRF